MVNVYLKTTCLKCKKEEVISDKKYYLEHYKHGHTDCNNPQCTQLEEPVPLNYHLLQKDNKLECQECKEHCYLSFVSQPIIN